MDLSVVKFDEKGLIPAVVQDARTGEVLMLAYMNRESLLRTLSTGRMTYWSRSRGKLWVKGERSGNFQLVREVRVDCDGDALLFKVEQVGAACHTGYRSCFYRKLEGERWKEEGEKLFDPEAVYGEKTS
ncbi:MAG: phosphoribosyl-AMP cyclohydrolase [Candidatus Latescibacterota bacterium]|nr:MAG: phosphoribosyl-AMP cyclohydrolase [Candidatus Latescibacterota bacterium]RKY63838.1 MAG: phosphoribosyl-AMP cyclohydrolase [Candidatus Latescibacterota bacterium]RKY74298.1 MAG: phosphoribosyl-AMP cyclohydrolase [Candidatus Latescibacterota bacterium]